MFIKQHNVESDRELPYSQNLRHCPQGLLRARLWRRNHKQRLLQEGAKRFAAELLNRRTTGKSLALFIIFMLQGAWYDLIQKIQCE
jgi:hypothetical protein